MKFIYLLLLIMIQSQLLCMEEDKKKIIDPRIPEIIEHIKTSPGRVEKSLIISEEGSFVERYFLRYKDDTNITEIYFSKDNMENIDWYGSVSLGKAMHKFILEGKEAEEGFIAIKERYEQEEKDYLNYLISLQQQKENPILTQIRKEESKSEKKSSKRGKKGKKKFTIKKKKLPKEPVEV